jgi:hypothetical protein
MIETIFYSSGDDFLAEFFIAPGFIRSFGCGIRFDHEHACDRRWAVGAAYRVFWMGVAGHCQGA